MSKSVISFRLLKLQWNCDVKVFLLMQKDIYVTSNIKSRLLNTILTNQSFYKKGKKRYMYIYIYMALEEMYTKMIKDSFLPDEIVCQLNF